MRKAAPGASWVREENLHLSIKFFGEQPDAAPGELRKILAGIAAGQQPLDLRISGLGAFPNLRAPRVVWMGVQHDPRLELMHHDVEATCAANGFALDARAFRPHITLARMRDEMPLANARALAVAARAVGYKGVQQIAALSLLESTLSAGGPRYTKVASIPLGGG
jgi:2'-5' RNA ligase